MSQKQTLTFSILAFLMAAAAVWFWWSWQKLLLNPYALIFGGEELLSKALLFALAATSFLVCISLVNLLVFDQRFRIGTFLLASLAVVPIYHFSVESILVAFAFFGVLLFFSYQARRLIADHLRFSTGHVLAPSLSVLLTIISLLFAAQYFFAAQANLDKFKLEIPDFLFDQVFQFTQSLFGQGLPFVPPEIFESGETQGLDTSTPLGQLPINDLLSGKIPIPPEWIPYLEQGELPPEVEEELQLMEDQLPPGVSLEMVKDLLQSAKIDEEGRINLFDSTAPPQAMGDPLKKMLETQLNDLITQYREYAPMVLAVLVFLIFKSFSGLVNIFAVWVLMIFLQVLLWAKVAKKERETVQAERIVIK